MVFLEHVEDVFKWNWTLSESLLQCQFYEKLNSSSSQLKNLDDIQGKADDVPKVSVDAVEEKVDDALEVSLDNIEGNTLQAELMRLECHVT